MLDDGTLYEQKTTIINELTGNYNQKNYKEKPNESENELKDIRLKILKEILKKSINKYIKEIIAINFQEIEPSLTIIRKNI